MGRQTNKQRRANQSVSAREKAAAARVAQQRAAQRQRAQRILSGVVVVVLVGVAIAFVAIHHKKTNTVSGNRVVASPTVLKAVDTVSDSTLQAVGQGTANPLPKKINDPALTSQGKPDLLFVGAEFCPYCAAERWPLIEALDKFGTFTGLNQVSSSSSDVDPNTPSFSFYKSSYTSKYLTFTPVENEDRNHKTLVQLTAKQQAIMTKYTDGYPFLYFGGKYAQTTQSYDPGLLAGLTQAKIAAQLNTPSSPIAKAIDGSANAITATICTMTNGMPANVCLVPAITNLQSQLNA